MKDTLAEFLEFSKPAQCPRCGSTRVAWVVFGLPSEEAVVDAQENDDVVFGGCIVDFDAPPFYCKNCQFEWGKEELQQREERRAQLPKAQQAELWRMSAIQSLEAQAEQARRREERIIQYYRDRHARRLHPQPIAPQVFIVEYQGQPHQVKLNERGQLAFLTSSRQKSAEASAVTASEEGFRTMLLRGWREKSYELPD